MLKALPDNSPLIANTLICRACGDKMEPAVVKTFSGKIDHLVYEHRNEETGCSYRIESNVMVNAEMKAMRADGTPVKL